MKQFDIKNNIGEILIHMDGDNSNYAVTFEHGNIIFQNATRKYVVPKNIGHQLQYNRKDPNTNKIKYVVNEVRTMYRDTTPTDFGITNKVDVALSSSHFTEEIIVNGINAYVPVVAPAGVIIYVNDVVVGSGTMIDNGDRVKFQIIASNDYNITSTFNIAVGDIVKTVTLKTLENTVPLGITTVGLDMTKFSYSHGGNGGYGFIGWRAPNINETIHDGWGDVWCRYYDDNQTVIYTPFDNSQIKITSVGNNGAAFNPSVMYYNGKTFAELGLGLNSIINLTKGYSVFLDTLGGSGTNLVGYTRIN